MSATSQQYDELVSSAPPETIEQIHEEAFERLSSAEREEAFAALVEHATGPDTKPADSSPAALAKAATAQELDQPGSLDRYLRDREGHDSLFQTFAAYAIGSELAFAYLTVPLDPDLFGGDGGDGSDFGF
ncbi:MAG TPA: hypothetical protein VF479_09160 [Pseudolysinimonas sp.]